MCYSAQIERDWRKYLRVMGTEATLNLGDFIKKYWWRVEDAKIKIPKALDAWFADPKTDDEAKIAEAIKRYNTERLAKCEQTVFAQRKRVADAERSLATKVTKKAQEDVRIGSAKVEENLGWIADLKRAEFKTPRCTDVSRLVAPVIVSDNGKPTVKLMRYQCRPAGKPKFLRQVARHVQRAQGQSGGRSGRTVVRLQPRHHAGEHILRECEQAQGRTTRISRRRKGRERRTGVQAARHSIRCMSRAYGRIGRKAASRWTRLRPSLTNRRRSCCRGSRSLHHSDQGRKHRRVAES